ncbi:hypothetical protein RvY_13053-2 [Ramazzottius varieornatus]|uniref:Uncharacterized protein n=1 Tax=Ramazzottius varieornatus TaxID=947166 RepID=A0A1D1VQM6_RAMVA|nr:hypothetical protein RvY_13053-2 [Ramazzottius varieornatus]
MNRPAGPGLMPPVAPFRSGHGSAEPTSPRPILVRPFQPRHPSNSAYQPPPVQPRGKPSVVKTSHLSIGQSGIPNVPAISITQNYAKPQTPPQMPAGYRPPLSRPPLVPPRYSRVSIPRGSIPYTIPVGNGSLRQVPLAPWPQQKTTQLDNTDSGTIREQGLLSSVAHQVLPSRSSDFSLPARSSVRNVGANETSAIRFPTGTSFAGRGDQDQLPQRPSPMKYDPQPRSTMQRPTAIQLQMPPPYVPPPIDTYDPTSAHYRYKDELIDIGEMDKIGGRCGFCLEKFWLRMKRFLHKICPCFYALFSSKEEEYQLYKAILGFPFGVAVGVLFYYAMIDRLKLNTFFRFMMGTMMLIVMSMGYARSIKIRCVVWLIFPCFFGKSGRDILMTMAIGALLTGPVSNTMDNFKESVRTVTCMTELMINMTMVRFELTGKPIFSIVRNFVGSERMDKMTGKLHKSLSPVKNEVENTKETKEEEVKAARMDAEMGTKRSDYFHEQERKNAAKLAKEDGGNKSKAFAVDTSYIKKLDYRCNSMTSLLTARMS